MPYLIDCTVTPEPVDCRILTAALDLFVEKGYHRVSIHEIQRRAKVSIGSIYNHFGGKEGVAKALHQHILNELDMLIDRVAAEVDSPRQQCERLIRQLFEHTETHRNIIAFAFHAKHAEFIPDEALVCDEAPFVKMRQMVARGVECGEFVNRDPLLLAATLFGGMIRLIQLRLDGVIEQSLNDFASDFPGLLWSGILREEELPVQQLA